MGVIDYGFTGKDITNLSDEEKFLVLLNEVLNLRAEITEIRNLVITSMLNADVSDDEFRDTLHRQQEKSESRTQELKSGYFSAINKRLGIKS